MASKDAVAGPLPTDEGKRRSTRKTQQRLKSLSQPVLPTDPIKGRFTESKFQRYLESHSKEPGSSAGDLNLLNRLGCPFYDKFGVMITPASMMDDETRSITNTLGMDCKMVETARGSMLSRVSIVNEYGFCLLDRVVKPRRELEGGVALDVISKQVSEILKGHVIVGHQTDKFVHWFNLENVAIIDTSEHFKQENLQILVEERLGVVLNPLQLDSISIAQAVVMIYKKDENAKKQENNGDNGEPLRDKVLNDVMEEGATGGTDPRDNSKEGDSPQNSDIGFMQKYSDASNQSGSDGKSDSDSSDEIYSSDYSVDSDMDPHRRNPITPIVQRVQEGIRRLRGDEPAPNQNKKEPTLKRAKKRIKSIVGFTRLPKGFLDHYIQRDDIIKICKSDKYRKKFLKVIQKIKFADDETRRVQKKFGLVQKVYKTEDKLRQAKDEAKRVMLIKILPVHKTRQHQLSPEAEMIMLFSGTHARTPFSGFKPEEYQIICDRTEKNLAYIIRRIEILREWYAALCCLDKLRSENAGCFG